MGTPPNGRNRLAANGQVWSATIFARLATPRAILARVGLQAATLLLSVALRWTALASAATLVVFAASMFFCSGFEAPLNASVFSAAAAALLFFSAHRAVTSSASTTCAGPGAQNRKQ